MQESVPMKHFVICEAERLGVTCKTIFRRIWRGEYRRAIEVERKNARVILVRKIGEPEPPRKPGSRFTYNMSTT